MKTLTQNRTALVAALALCGLGTPALANFNYNNFSNTTGLNLVGVAEQSGNRILVTPSIGASAGAVWAAQKQNVSNGFDAYMTINVEDKNGIGADGMALVIQNSSATALGASGGAMGYGRNVVFGAAGIANSIAIAFDMWDNNILNWEESGDNHVTVQTRGMEENSVLLPFSLGNAVTPDLSDGAVHAVHVNYTPGVLSIYLDQSLVPILQVAVNLSTLLALDNGGNGQAWIGVTAATGAPQNSEAHVLNSFAFNGCPIPTPGTASLLALGGLVGYRRRR